MKDIYWTPYKTIFKTFKPKTICEIGTHNGRSAVQFCKEALLYNTDVIYSGFDLFEMATDENHVLEHNGKGSGNFSRATKYLDSIKKDNAGFEYTLTKGYTQDTLKLQTYDFVYIDAGHSYESVMHDYEKVKDSKVIAFDDLQIEGVEQALKEIGGYYELNVDCPRNKRRQAIIIKDFDPEYDTEILGLFR